MSRIKQIDIAKGFGIMLVILGHLFEGHNETVVLHNWIYSFHMPLFFFLSGTVSDMRDWKEKHTGLTDPPHTYIYKLLRSLGLPYLIWSVLATLYELLRNLSDWKNVLFGNAVNTLTTYGIAPFWFLGTLLLVEIVAMFAWKKRVIAYLVLGISLLIGSIGSFAGGVISALPGVVSNAIVAFFRMCWGVVFVSVGRGAAPILRKIEQGPRIPVWTVVCVVGFGASLVNPILNHGFNFHKMKIGNPALFFLSALGGTVFIISLSFLIGKAKWLEFVGQRSLGIMCLHYKTLPIWLLSTLVIPDGLPLWISLPLRFLFLLAVCLVLTVLIQKLCPVLLGKLPKRKKAA